MEYLYNTEVAQSVQPTQKILVMLHGYGADGNDLIGLAHQFQSRYPATKILSPHAPNPCGQNPYGREWFALNTFSPQEIAMGAQSATAELCAYLVHVAKIHQLELQDLVLLGFSQGTMMALNALIHCATSSGYSSLPSAVIGFSGLLATQNPPTQTLPPILLVHGTDDNVVPYDQSVQANETLKQWGAKTQLHTCQGVQHAIDQNGLQAAVKFAQPHLI